MKKIKGKVFKIFFPKIGFEEFGFMSFLLKTSEGYVRCRGEIPIYNIGDNIICEGDYIKDGKYGLVFDIKTVERNLEDEVSITTYITYLAGPKTAETLISHFGNGEKVLEVIKDNPDEILNIKGFGNKKKDKIVNRYNKSAYLQQIFLFLKKYGFTVEESRKALKEIGKDCIKIIKENPYVLTSKLDFSFVKCDKIAIAMGFDLSSAKRYSAGVVNAVRQNKVDGHCFTKIDEIVDLTREILTINNTFLPSINEIKKTIKTLISNDVLVLEDNDLYFKSVFDEKENLCDFVKRAILSKTYSYDFNIDKSIQEYENKKSNELHCKYRLGEQQKLAVKNCLEHKISIITGGPGVGKTTVLDCILDIFVNSVGYRMGDIALCSPTGKAAKRMTESTGFPASTIHRLLVVSAESMTNNRPQFVYNKENKLNYKLIVIDESSMLDYNLASSLIDAIKNETRVIFVGDIDQLPPVSYGYTLRDFIESGIPTGRLTEVKRQKGDSSIIPLSQMIRDDRMKMFKANDFAFRSLTDTDQIIKLYLRGLEDLRSKGEANALDQIVILTPQNKGDYGTKNLNILIQEKLFPNPDVVIHHNGYPFVVGSKVLQVNNNNDIGIVNGEIGYVRSIDLEEKTIAIEFDDSNIQIYDSEMMDDLKLGYVMTVHKSQGSEWKFVIEIVDSSSRMNTRNLVYTGVTRTREKLIVLGDVETFVKCPKLLGSKKRSKLLNN